MSETFKKNLTLVMLNTLHHLNWKQGQVARRKSKMEQRKKAREEF
jgi:hypothetical protein